MWKTLSGSQERKNVTEMRIIITLVRRRRLKIANDYYVCIAYVSSTHLLFSECCD